MLYQPAAGLGARENRSFTRFKAAARGAIHLSVDEMQRNAGAFSICRIAQRAMRHAISEESDTTRRQLNRHRLVLRRITADVMIAKGIAAVRVGHAVAAGNDVDGAVGNGGIVHSRPHRRPLQGVIDLEVSIVLMPIGAGALLARLEKYLIQMQYYRVADKLPHRRNRFLGEGHGAVKVAMREHRAQLQIDLVFGGGLAIADGGDVAQQTDRFQAIKLKPHRPHFARGPEFFLGDPTFTAKLFDFGSCKHSRRLLVHHGYSPAIVTISRQEGRGN